MEFCLSWSSRISNSVKDRKRRLWVWLRNRPKSIVKLCSEKVPVFWPSEKQKKQKMSITVSHKIGVKTFGRHRYWSGTVKVVKGETYGFQSTLPCPVVPGTDLKGSPSAIAMEPRVLGGMSDMTTEHSQTQPQKLLLPQKPNLWLLSMSGAPSVLSLSSKSNHSTPRPSLWKHQHNNNNQPREKKTQMKFTATHDMEKHRQPKKKCWKNNWTKWTKIVPEAIEGE